VNLAGGIIDVSASWDDVEGEVSPKSERGKRKVPIVGVLRDVLTALKASTGRGEDDFVFGPKPGVPFDPVAVWRNAGRSWKSENERRAKAKRPLLMPISLHELRHTFVSLMFDAGVPLERVGDFVGHSSLYMVDQYRHLIEGAEAEAAKRFDEYLARADTGARLEQLGA
jgi:integrase